MFLSPCVCRYDDPLSPLGQHASTELSSTKRHLFGIPSSHCNLDLEEYEYEEDFEWRLIPVPNTEVSVWLDGAVQRPKYCSAQSDTFQQVSKPREEFWTFPVNGWKHEHLTSKMKKNTATVCEHIVSPPPTLTSGLLSYLHRQWCSGQSSSCSHKHNPIKHTQELPESLRSSHVVVQQSNHLAVTFQWSYQRFVLNFIL